jgi:hypothetical protein
MQWLLDYSEKYRAQLRQGPFFTSLSRADRPNDLQWIHQLVHQSREFTQSLCLRYLLNTPSRKPIIPISSLPG